MEAGYNALIKVPRVASQVYKVYARRPEDIVRDLALKVYGEEWAGVGFNALWMVGVGF
jgi:hypothetical protein